MSETEGSFSVTLPLPPSTNELYFHRVAGKKVYRVPTRAYEEWRREAARAVEEWPQPPFKTTWEVSLYVYFPRWNRDLDNIVKPTLDLLTGTMGLHDNRVVQINVYRHQCAEGAEPRLDVYVDWFPVAP